MNKTNYENIIKPIFLSIFLIIWFILISLLGGKFIYLNSAYNPPDSHINNINDFFYNYSHHWDTNYYKGIAKYKYNNKYKENLVFFPLLPLEIKSISVLTRLDINTSAILTGFLNFILFSIILFLFLKTYLERNKSKNNLLIIFILSILSPFAVFHQFIYTEALFNILILLIFYLLMKNDKLLNLLPLSTFALVLTRNVGITIIPALFYFLYLNRNELRKKKEKYISIVFSIFSASLGIIIYMFYSWKITGNFFYFILAQSHWGRSFNLNFINIFITDFVVTFNLAKFFPFIEFCKNNLSIDCYLGHLFSFLALILSLIIIIISLKKFKTSAINKTIILFSFLVMLAPIFSGASTSYNRYLLVAPIYLIFLPIYLGNKLSTKKAILLISMLFTFYSFCLLLFINGYWVG